MEGVISIDKQGNVIVEGLETLWWNGIQEGRNLFSYVNLTAFLLMLQKYTKRGGAYFYRYPFQFII